MTSTDNRSAALPWPWFDTVRFETPAEGVPAAPAPASPGEAVAAAEPLAAGEGAGAAVDATAAPAPEPVPAEPAFDPRELQAEIEYLREQNEAFVQWAREQGASPAQAQQYANEQTGFDPSSLNPLDDDFGPNFARFLQERDERLLGAIDQRFQAIQAPLMAREEAETIAEGEQRLQDILADDIARNGEFSTDPEADKQARALVRTLADQQFNDVAARYGVTPRAAEIAMARAADQVRGLLKAAGVAAVARTANHNAALAGAPSEPGTGAGSGLVTIPDTVSDPSSIASEVARKYGGLIRAQ